MTDTDNDPNEPAATPGMLALQALINNGGWIPLPGFTSAAMFIRMWPDGSADTLAAYGDVAARAERTDPQGIAVWRRTAAPLATVCAELRELPSPDAPEAPRTPLTDDMKALTDAMRDIAASPSPDTPKS